MNLARSSIKLFLSKSLTSAIGFVSIAYFSNRIGAASMGVFFLFQALLGMLSIPTDLGLRGAAQKRISEGDDPGQYLSSAITLKLIPITVILLLVYIFKSYINNYLGSDLAILLAVVLVLKEFAQLTVFILRGELRVDETAILNVIKQITWVVVGAAFLALGYEATGLVYGLLAGFGIMFAVGWYKISVSPRQPTRSHASSLFEFSRYGFITSIGGYFYSWVDVTIIGLFLTQADVGAYEVAWRITGVTILLSMAIGDTLLPQVSQWSSGEETSKIETAIQNAVTPSMLLVIPSFFGVLLLSHEILGIVFGSEFTIAWLALIILMAGKVLQSVHILLSRVIMGLDRPEIAARATIIAVFTNFVLNVIFVLQFGLIGAAIATVVASGLNTILHGYQLSNFIRIKIPYRELGWCVFAGLGMTVSLLFIEELVPVTSLLTLFSTVLFGALVYFGIVLASPNLRTKLRVRITSAFAS